LIAIDTNILVYAHREDSQFHGKAYALLKEIAESKLSWAIPYPCIHEFYAIVTHTKIFNPPTSTDLVIEQLEAWMKSPSLQLLGESAGYFEILKSKLTKGKLQGSKVHDARIISICIQNGVNTLYSSDRDFNKIAGLKIQNPLI
jgi:toxin-antitoxin system PIN domain toxin